jgi:hypothetical protein
MKSSLILKRTLCFLLLFGCLLAQNAWRNPQTPTQLNGPINFWVAAPGLTTCSYGGGAAVACTPSTDTVFCGTTPATPCSDFVNMEARLRSMLIFSVVTINVSDTAGGIAAPTGKCYQPNELQWHNQDINGITSDSFFGATDPVGGTYDYPRNYIYFLGNTTTPTNVNITGASTCAGTTPVAHSGIKFTGDMRVRVRGLSFNYFGGVTQQAIAGVECWNNSVCYLEDMSATGNGTFALASGYHNTLIIFGGQITVTDCSVAKVTEFSDMELISPLSRANFTLVVNTGITLGNPFFHSNENSIIQVDGASINVSGSGSGNVWGTNNHGVILWNDNSTFTAPAQTVTYNVPNMTILSAVQGSMILDKCRTVGQLTCTYTAMLRHAHADNLSVIMYPGSNAGTNADTATVGSLIMNNNNGTSGNFTVFSGPGVAVASATSPTLDHGNIFHITGTTTITSLNPCDSNNTGREVTLIFDGALTFSDGNNLILAGNFVTTANDTIKLVCDGSNWYEIARSLN